MGGPAPDPTQVRALVGQGRLLPAGYTGHGEGAGALKSSRLGWRLTAFPSRVADALQSYYSDRLTREIQVLQFDQESPSSAGNRRGGDICSDQSDTFPSTDDGLGAI